MPVIKATIRILGLVWLGLLVVIALKLTPSVQATVAPQAADGRGGPRALADAAPPPVQGSPRVVYQGPVIQGVAAPRPTDARPAAAQAVRQDVAAASPSASPSIAPEASPGPAVRSEPAQGPAPSSSRPLDLNTASVAELNGLKGAGMIGRAIVQARPYRSPEDLLAKRVLSRAAYSQIRDQVVVR